MKADTLWMEIGDILRGRYYGREILWEGDTLWREILCGGRYPVRYPGEGDTLGRDTLGGRYSGEGDTLGREITSGGRYPREGDTIAE